jgi:putative multiple sugar transport system permease protein
MFKKNIRQYAMLIALVFIMILFQILTHGILLVPMNVTNLILQNAYVFILAIGMTLCILTGGNIDLSVGSVVAFIGALCGNFIVTMKMPLGVSLVFAILIGLIIGIWQGFWIAYVRIPAFIVTLAGQLLFRGLTLFMLKGLTLGPFPEAFQSISSGFVPDILGSGSPTGVASQGGALNGTAIVVGVLLAAVYIFFQLRRRAAHRRNGFEVPPFGAFLAQIILVSVAILLITFWLAQY